MSIFSFFTIFASSSFAGDEGIIRRRVEDTPSFQFKIHRGDFNEISTSEYDTTFVGVPDTEYNHSAPYQLEIVDLGTETNQRTFTVEHQYQLQVSCVTRGSQIEYTHRTKAVPLYGKERSFAPKEAEFLSRKNSIDEAPLKAILSTKVEEVFCNQSVVESIYIIKLEGIPIHTFYLYSEGAC